MKIAILLPEDIAFDTIGRAAKLASLLTSLKCSGGKSVEVVVALPVGDENLWRRREGEIRSLAPSVVVRHLSWERVESAMALRMYPHVQADLDGIAEVSLPRDWGWNFIDCDAWLIFADAALGAVLPVRPVGYYLRDLAVRYVPSAFASGIHAPYWQRQTDAFRLWRQSRVVFAASVATLNDAASYAGIRRDRLLKVPPLMASGPNGERRPRRGPLSLLWLVEPDARHDLTNALEGLRLFKAEGGQADIVVAGARRLDSDDTSSALAEIAAASQNVMGNISHETIQTDEDLRRLLRRIDMIWSSAIADGENEGLLRASAAGLPFIGNLYPQNEALVDRLGIRAFLHQDRRPAAIADELHRACADIQSAPARRGEANSLEPLPEEWLPVLDRVGRRYDL